MAHLILGIDVPTDPDVRIWRYMSLSKFERLCQTQSLWFSRADKFDDKWEDVVSSLTASKHLNVAKWIDERRGHTFVNCWHVNEVESNLMWGGYTGGNAGIVIESTYGRLAGVLESHRPIVYLGLVKYIDYNSETLDGWQRNPNVYHPIMHKRRMFDGERELRAVINPMSNESLAAICRGDPGMVIPVGLQQLIVSIRVGEGPPHLMQHVQAIAADNGIAAPVTASEICQSPPAGGKGGER